MSKQLKLAAIECYKSITAETEFVRWKLSDKVDGKDHLQAEWSVTLRSEGRVLKVPFLTGMRDLEGPIGTEKFVFDECGFLSGVGSSTRPLKSTNPNFMRRLESLLRRAVTAKTPSPFGDDGKATVLAKKVRPLAPTASDVVYCVASDTESVIHSTGFESWAKELGFNPDSRRAYKIWLNCQQQTGQFSGLIRGDMQLFCEFVRLIDEKGSLEAAEEEFLKEENQ